MSWLKDKKNNVLYLGISLILILVSYLVNDYFRETFPRKFSESIFWLTVPVFVFSIITFLVKRDTFQSWTKLTNYLFSISIVIILLTPTSTHGLDFFPIVKETVTIFLAILYSIISLILIIFKSLKKDSTLSN